MRLAPGEWRHDHLFRRRASADDRIPPNGAPLARLLAAKNNALALACALYAVE
jgi:hypothetical protein